MNGEADGQRRAIPARTGVSGLATGRLAKRKSGYSKGKN
jgi:hypothetical protein